MLIISQIITQLLTSTASVISESNCQQETEKWPFVAVVYFVFVRSKLGRREPYFISVSVSDACVCAERARRLFFLLVNGVL